MRYSFFVITFTLAACTGSDGPVLIPHGDASVDFDGSVSPKPWTTMESGTTTDLYAIWATSGSSATAVGGAPGSTTGSSGVIVEYDGATWTPSSHLVNLLTVTANMAGGEYGGEASTTHRDPPGWAPRVVLGTGRAFGAWETSNGTYAVVTTVLGAEINEGRVLFSSSLTDLGWQVVDTGATDELYAVWGSSPTDVYAVGANGVILHNANAGGDGSGTWTRTTHGSSTLVGIWGSSADDVYIVGDAPAVILHSTDRGATWTEAQLPISGSGLYAIAGSSPTNVYAVGLTDGVALHSSGDNVWTTQPLPTTRVLNAVTVTSDGTVFAVGSTGTIVRKAP